jgi:hypothetical protein
LWEDIRLPFGARLIYREDLPELGGDDFRNQLYLKLLAHRYVESDYYVVMDSDFLFIAPCDERAFFHQGRPVWFHTPWDEVASRWRKGSEAFVGEPIDRNYMCEIQYVMSRPIAAELCRRYPMSRILEGEGISEFIVYGWFAHRYFQNAYEWADLQSGRIKPVAQKVNQVPPSYCELDPRVSIDDFPGARFVAFWSYWDLAEPKMAEFLREAQRRQLDRPAVWPSEERIYPLIDLPARPESLYTGMHGAYSDGWLKDEVWFSVVSGPTATRLCMRIEVPVPAFAGTWQVDGGAAAAFGYDCGVHNLEIALTRPATRHRILLRLDATGRYATDDTGRCLRARLLSMCLKNCGGETITPP